MYVCMDICMSVHTYIYAYGIISIVYPSTAPVCVYIFVFACICMYACIYTYMFIYVCITQLWLHFQSIPRQHL